MLKNQNGEEAYKKGEKVFSKRLPVWVTLLAVLLSVLVTLCAVFAAFKISPLGKVLSKIVSVDTLVNQNFLGKVDYLKLDDELLTGYFEGLDDKYAFYENSEGAKEINDSFLGNTTGIGVSVFYDDQGDSLQIFRVNSGSPAEAAGIKVGDKLISIDGKTVKELGSSAALKVLKKTEGETSTCGILRGEETLVLKITHKQFVKQSVYYHTVGDFGYVCFTEFSEATVKQFENCLLDLTEKKVKGLIFDLRDNGGGTVDSVCKILDILVGECDLITVKYKDNKTEVMYRSDKEETLLPMTVLVNGNTASAAELFAATIRDMDKGKLIGNTTYGKGVMQRTYNLSDGSCVRFTVAEFLPAGGKSFNETGIKPDFKVEFTKEQAKNKYILGDSDPYIVKALEVFVSE